MATRESKALRRVQRMRGLPKSRLKRLAWRMHPRQLAAFWFSRDGGIMTLKIAGISIFILFVLILGIFAFFRKDLPNLRDISGDNLGGSISYYDRTGKDLLWQDYDAVKRVPVEGEEISQYIKDATVAIEDRDFYEHKGFDIRGIMRATLHDITNRGSTQGGSTITQQLVKLTQEFGKKRTIILKMKELILAVELERTYTKDEILTGYLNAAPYGDVDYGIKAAAADYFHVLPKDLTLAQSAMLAAIPKAPSYYSPYVEEWFDAEALIGRQHYVLDVMVDMKTITKAQAEEAKKVDILAQVQPQQSKYAGIESPYFVLAAKNQLTREVESAGSAKVGGWKVITTLDTKLQKLADDQVQKGLGQVRRQGGDVAAFAAQDVKTGQMVALVGGGDFDNKDYGKINYAQWPVSPGSSFKPYDYLTLIENSTNAGAGSVLYDVRGPLPGYPCTNKARPKSGGNCLHDYDFRFPGALTLRYALGASRNIPAVKAMLTSTVEKTIKTAEEMGLRSGYKCYKAGTDVANATAADEDPCYASSALGDGSYLRLDEHVNGFATIARLGTYLEQTYILDVKNAAGKSLSGFTWRQPEKEPEKKQVIRPESAYIVADILSDPRASYFTTKIYHRYNGWNFSLKTGTTNDSKDGLLMGFSGKYAAGVWVGYHTRQRAMSGFMETMTRPIWSGWMTAAHSGLKPENISRPSGIQTLPAYVIRNHVGSGTIEPSPTNDLYPSWYKAKTGTNKSSTIDRVSNKLATSCTPVLARQTVGGNSRAEQFSIDIFYGAGSANATTTAQDDVHACGDTKPDITVTVSNNLDGTYSIVGTATAGSHPFKDSRYPQFPGKIHLSVNGKVIKSCNIAASPASCTANYTPASNGKYSISAQVIDSVLYEATDAVSANLTKPPTEEPPGGGGEGGED
ncbi:MAG: transglycosylase domain-containing protein [Candidatus Saccharimonadales bacterium]